MLSTCLCFRNAKSSSVYSPFHLTAPPAEVSSVGACFLRERAQLHHASGSPEIKKETGTQLQLQLSLPDLHSWTVLQSHLSTHLHFPFFLFSPFLVDFDIRTADVQMGWKVQFLARYLGQDPPATSHLLTWGRAVTLGL